MEFEESLRDSYATTKIQQSTEKCGSNVKKHDQTAGGTLPRLHPHFEARASVQVRGMVPLS